jgi:hypothetical protein
MADNLKAAAFAAGLSPQEQKKVEDFNKALSIHKELSNLPSDVANAKYSKYTPTQQADLQKNFGNEDPTVKPDRGALGTAWYYTGGALGRAIGYTGGKVLAGLGNVSDLSTRAYRTGAIAIDQGVDLGSAWTIANDKGDKVFSPTRIIDAQTKFGQDAVDVAVRIASGEKPEAILKTATPEQIKYLRLADPTNKVIPGIEDNKVEAARGLFQDTLDAVQAAKYSPGRQVANLVLPGQLEGSGFFYKAISGTVDAAYRIIADPLLVAGKAKRAYDVGKYALDVVVGKGAVKEVFSKPSVINFWNQYGTKLDELSKAQAKKEPIAIAQARKDLQILAPELGPAVIKALQKADVPVINAKTAQAFFENTKQLDEMLKGQIGRKRVIIPRMDPVRQARIAAVTTGRKVFNLDAVGPRLVDDLWFGGNTDADGIAETIINGQKVIVDKVTKATKFKGIARFSTEYLQFRIDRAKAALTIAPMFKDDFFDVTAVDAADKIYRLAIMVMPRRESKLLSEAFDAIAETGKKKEVYYGLWSTISELRGLNTNLPGQALVRQMTGKVKSIHSINKADDAFPEMGSLPSDFNNFVAVPTLADLDRAAARNGLFQKMIGVANGDLASRMTSAWSFLTLAGPRYALRNAGEDLMVNLAIGQSPWGLAKSRVLSTRINTYLQAVKKVEGKKSWSDNPLGSVMRIVNRKDVDKYTQELTALSNKFDEGKASLIALKKELSTLTKDTPEYAAKSAQIQAINKELAGGITAQAREIFARSLSEGRLNRLRSSLGLPDMNKLEIDLLTEQIKYGDIENALAVASEGGLNFVTGNDYITRATNIAKQTGVRVHALEIAPSPSALVRAKGERTYSIKALDPQDEASMYGWLMRIGYFANDELGTIAVANLDNQAAYLRQAREWLKTKKGQKFVADARASTQMDSEQLLRLTFNRTEELFLKSADNKLNTELLDKIRTLDDAGNWKVTGSISMDDLPTKAGDIPAAFVGPTLVPAVSLDQVTSSVMNQGWTFLGLSNARMSRQPIVLQEMLQIRKEMRKSGFEDKWIESYIKGIDPENTTGIAIATERAKKALANVVEERATNQILQYVDNPLVRTQLAFSSRNFARFYRATEDFYRRMYRTIRYNPEAIQKAALTYEGFTHSGWIQQDDQGESYFVYPGIGPVYNAVQDALGLVGIEREFKIPFPVEFGAKVKMLTPSLNPDSIVPTFSGPISGVSFAVITELISGLGAPGAADTIKGYALGKYAVDQPIVSAFLPAHINRLYAAMDQDDRNSQYASAWRKAVTYLEASGHGLPKKYDEAGNLIPPTPGEREAYRLSVKNTTLTILGMRFVAGFFAPASPSVSLKSDMAQWISDNGRANFKQTWNKLLEQYPGDYEGAMAKWVELYPNQIPFTVTESEKKTIAPVRYAEESGNFVDQNGELFKKYPSAAGFLIPHKTGFSWDAYKSMKDMGLLYNKRVDDYLLEVQTAADLQQYYNRKNEYEAALKTAVVDFERTNIRQEFDKWKDVFFAGRPMVQEELSQGSEKAIKRLQTLDELNIMLDANLGVRPKTENGLRELRDTYVNYQNERANLEAMNASNVLIQNLKDTTLIRMRELSLYNENTKAAYDVLFSRLPGIGD